MFFRRPPNRNMTIDQVDFDNNPALLTNMSDCIFNAVEKRDVNTLKQIYDVSTQHNDKLSSEAILNNIYSHVIEASFTAHEFKTLFEMLPIDVNQKMTNNISVSYGRNAYYQDTLIHIAAEKHQKDIFHFLVEHGADLTSLSHDGKTLAEVIQNRIARGKHWPDEVPDLEAMLATLEARMNITNRTALKAS